MCGLLRCARRYLRCRRRCISSSLLGLHLRQRSAGAALHGAIAVVGVFIQAPQLPGRIPIRVPGLLARVEGPELFVGQFGDEVARFREVSPLRGQLEIISNQRTKERFARSRLFLLLFLVLINILILIMASMGLRCPFGGTWLPIQVDIQKRLASA